MPAVRLARLVIEWQASHSGPCGPAWQSSPGDEHHVCRGPALCAIICTLRTESPFSNIMPEARAA